MSPGFIAILVVGLGVGVRLVAGALDRRRIRDYFSARRCELIACNWAPFGRGWFGEKGERIYEIRYRDREGAVRAATAKTSLLTSVYLTEDRRVVASKVERSRAPEPAVPASGSAAGDAQPTAEQLAAENRRLRTEIERLRRRSR